MKRGMMPGWPARVCVWGVVCAGVCVRACMRACVCACVHVYDAFLTCQRGGSVGVHALTHLGGGGRVDVKLSVGSFVVQILIGVQGCNVWG
jgi:hypothetical protein